MRATVGDALYRRCPICGGPYVVGDKLDNREMPERRQRYPLMRRLDDFRKRLVVGHAYCSPKP